MATKLSTAAAATNDKRRSSAAKGDTLSSSTTATRNKEKYIVRTRKVREEGLYFVGRDIWNERVVLTAYPFLLVLAIVVPNRKTAACVYNHPTITRIKRTIDSPTTPPPHCRKGIRRSWRRYRRHKKRKRTFYRPTMMILTWCSIIMELRHHCLLLYYSIRREFIQRLLRKICWSILVKLKWLLAFLQVISWILLHFWMIEK